MTRRPDWQTLLDAFLREHQFDPFHYGRWDCCLFVCDAISVMTGVDPAAAFRGTYTSRMEARRAVRAAGSKSVEGLVAAVTADYGMPETAVLRAHRGDVALIRRSAGLVALNGREVIVTSSKGLWLVPLSMARRAWRV